MTYTLVDAVSNVFFRSAAGIIKKILDTEVLAAQGLQNQSAKLGDFVVYTQFGGRYNKYSEANKRASKPGGVKGLGGKK